jgi:hypothetical protein
MEISEFVTGLYYHFLNLDSSAFRGELKMLTLFYLWVPTLHQISISKNIGCYLCFLGFWFSVTWSIYPCYKTEN